jgi:undecaprenyl-diphosphatase
MQQGHRVAAATGLVFAVLTLLVAAQWSPLEDLDHGAVGPAVDVARDHDGYRRAMTVTTWLLHSEAVLVYTGLAAIALVVARRGAAALWLAAVVGVGTVVNPLWKQVVDRQRPVVPDPVETFSGLSFPSGHACSAALLCAALVVVLWSDLGGAGRRRLIVLAVAVPVLSSWTRMTLGGHYLSDVVGGVLLGVTWVAAWQPALPVLRDRQAPRAH